MIPMAKKLTYSVLIIDNFHLHDEEEHYTIDGFPTKELAIEFARRWVRDSLEEMRDPTKTKEEIKNYWLAFGEDAMVIDGGYRGKSELDFFIDNPAIPEEINWKEIKRIAGIK